MGRITCQFYQKQAPNAVANFIALAEGTKDWTDPATKKVQHHKPYYDGTIFHRVIPEFMIQGGDPTGTGMGDPGFTFDDEFDPNLNFDRPGRLAMANTGPIPTAASSSSPSRPTLAEPALHALRPVRRSERRRWSRRSRACSATRRQAADAGGDEESDDCAAKASRCRRRRVIMFAFCYQRTAHGCEHDKQGKTV